MEKNQSYRANAAALIVNTKGEFLLTQLVEARDNEWDFVKGGMRPGEEHLDTLKREIHEELGEAVRFQILERSDVTIVYDWPQELQIQKGFRGQARLSFWVLYEAGIITLNTDELKSYKWIPHTEVAAIMQASHFPALIIKSFMEEWESIKHRVLV